jgi:hypothetical protein
MVTSNCNILQQARKEDFLKGTCIVKKTTVIIQLDFIYCRVDPERKLWNNIVHIANDTKSLNYLSLYEGTIQLLSQKQTMIIIKKRQILARVRESDY